MKTLEDQLAEYGSSMRELHGPLPAPELPSTVQAARLLAPTSPSKTSGWLAAAAGVAVVLVLGLIGTLTRGGSPENTETPDPSAAPANIVGLPPEGSTPSDPTHADLVLQWGSLSTTVNFMWVYSDGRVLTAGVGRPAGLGDEFVGFAERRLTPEGVEFLRNQVLASGLFTGDLRFAREVYTPFLSIEVMDGDRRVSVTWASRDAVGDAPVPTPEQARALTALDALLGNPRSWPDEAWQEKAYSSYVPSEYTVCFGLMSSQAGAGHWLGQTDPSRVWALLPGPAQDLVRSGEAVPPEMHGDGGCSRMSTDAARTLAQILVTAGVPQLTGPEGDSVLFELRNQTIVSNAGVVGDVVWIQFGPVLPDGAAGWLGPG